MNETILEKVGFTKGEIKVYLALLGLGETTTGPLITRSMISSSKVYEILDRLSQKGLVSYIFKQKTKYFQPASPSKILDYIHAEKIKIETTSKEAEKLVEELNARHTLISSVQSATVYEGFEGIKSVFSTILDSLEKGEEYYVFTVDEEATSKELHLFFIQYHKRRVQKGIKVKLLSKEKFRKEIKTNYPDYKLSERRFIDTAFPTGVFIFKNNIMHFTYSKNPTLLVFSSKLQYESYKAFFEELWRKAVHD